MRTIILTLVTAIIFCFTALFFLNRSNQKKIVYADAIRLFNDYKFKIDMEKMGQVTLSRLQQELDSVGVIYKSNRSDPNAQQLVATAEGKLTEAYAAINKEINEKAWMKLNPLINKYGKEKGIDMLIGANGMGTVLYASESKDITEDLIKYVNEIYEKGN